MRSLIWRSRAVVPLLIISAGLGLVLSLPALVRGTGPIAAHLFPPEVIAIILVLLLLTRSGKSRLGAIGLGIVTGYLIGFAIVEAAVFYVYARPFVPASDIPMVRSLIQLTLGPIGVAEFLTPIAVMLLFGAFFVVGLGWVGIARLLVRRLPRPVPMVGSVLAVLLAGWLVTGVVAAGAHSANAPRQRSLAVESVTAWFRDGSLHLRELPFVGDALAASPAIRREAQSGSDPNPGLASSLTASAPLAPFTADAPAYAFPGILDRDIYIFAVEAYGYATVTQPEIAERLAPDLAALEEVLDRQGYTVAGSYLRSPVAGGFSWLAEATFLTGQWIDSQPAFEQLYGAGIPTLTGVLQEGGYHTFTVRPGTVHGAWPEGWDLYRFEHALVAYDGDFAYRGPVFSYVAITDQYAIWRAHRYITQAVAPGGAAAERPLLAYYQLVSSHTPFNRVPPVIQPWESLGDGSIYRERSAEIQTFDNTWSGGTEMIEGYSAAISYVLRAITKYVDEIMIHEREPVILIFGDHQAQRPIRENDAHLSVPIHIASRDPEIIDRFLEHGFERGLVSGEPPPHRDMSDFFPLFVEIARERRP